MITCAEAKELLEYRDGELYWKKSLPHSKTKIGDKAGCKENLYYRISIKNKRYGLHQIIFLMFNGYIPYKIDHKDGNGFNNLIENLRDGTTSQNAFNKKLSISNTSGIKNVRWEEFRQKWKVTLKVNGKQVFNYRFDDKYDAIQMARLARIKYHKEFARHV